LSHSFLSFCVKYKRFNAGLTLQLEKFQALLFITKVKQLLAFQLFIILTDKIGASKNPIPLSGSLLYFA